MAQYLLYLHGFNSSSLSVKAELTREYFTEHYPDIHFYCPQIASKPKAAIAQLDKIITQVQQSDSDANWFFIGSSLGGYFASYLSEKHHAPAVLINPAVKPYQLLTEYLGEQENPYTGEVYQVTTAFIDELKAVEQKKLVKNNYLLMVQTGDEVLDYRQAEDKYQNAQIIKQQEGDHSFIGYEKMLPNIVNFFQIA